VNFTAITLCVASQQVFIVLVDYFVIDSVRKLLDTPLYVRFVCMCVCVLSCVGTGLTMSRFPIQGPNQIV